jgi:hypothetical protein
MTKVSRHPLRHGCIAGNASKCAAAKQTSKIKGVFIPQSKLGGGRVFLRKPCFEWVASYRNIATEALNAQFVNREPHECHFAA